MEEQTKSKSAGPVAAVMMVVAMLPLFYGMSVGPVTWLVYQGYIDSGDDSIAYAFYWPLIWLGDQLPFLKSVFIWYTSLFAPPPA